MKKKVLLVEPDYKNKYPPIGLMKISTYHKMIGYDVKFFKGDLKGLILSDITSTAIKKLTKIDNNIDWLQYYNLIFDYIKTGKVEVLNSILDIKSKYKSILESWLIHFKDFYRKGTYISSPNWDRICITTLFTFYHKITIDTINTCKNLVKDINQIYVGGVMASVIPETILNETGIKPHIGLLNKSGAFDDNSIIIDNLPLDYSILDEIDYKYPENNAFYGYTTRGCIRKCSFCAVPTLEPKFEQFISISKQIEHARRYYGDRQNLLLLDNNVLASKKFAKIINEIKTCGFFKDSTYIEPNLLDIYIGNLRKKINDNAYIKATSELYLNLLKKLKGEDKQIVYNILTEYQLLNNITITKKSLLAVYPFLKEYYEKYRNKTPKHRKVDFNQGVDARLITNDNAKLLSEIAINPLRIAFDSMKYESVYTDAVRLCARYGIKSFSNYLLYNENDQPIELYQRLKINIELCEDLPINIYSFPMKYHPIFGEFNLNRDYIGKHWNRKFIRAIQTILNATKGKIGRGKSFFLKAFGESEDEYKLLLYMPEPYILYRFFFEEIGYTHKWKDDFMNLNFNERSILTSIVEINNFSKDNIKEVTNKKVKLLLDHYLITRDEILDHNTTLGKLKLQYDKKGTISPSVAQSC
ncbi:MAG: hypothetical protein WDA74_02105 [Spirochaetota bacterium]